MDQVGISGTALGAREALRSALERQEELLAALARRFEQTLATHPPPRLQEEWHGAAEQFYADAAEGLRRDLARVAEQLTAALADTRRALTTLGPGPVAPDR
ncbi:MAG TPA: hypothetical protein VLZ78_02215 [Terrimesophilobacter sp.]|jgi:hypothetical protein|nr:hypothetical protein [Terrimesophilobacter sp.]